MQTIKCKDSTCKGLLQCTLYALVLWMGMPYVAVMVGMVVASIRSVISNVMERSVMQREIS